MNWRHAISASQEAALNLSFSCRRQCGSPRLSLYKFNLVYLYHIPALWTEQRAAKPQPWGKLNTCKHTNSNRQPCSHCSVTDPLCALLAWRLFKRALSSQGYLFPELRAHKLAFTQDPISRTRLCWILPSSRLSVKASVGLINATRAGPAH